MDPLDATTRRFRSPEGAAEEGIQSFGSKSLRVANARDFDEQAAILEEAGDKFHVLPGVNEKVSDEILFANAEWLAANQETATVAAVRATAPPIIRRPPGRQHRPRSARPPAG